MLTKAQTIHNIEGTVINLRFINKKGQESCGPDGKLFTHYPKTISPSGFNIYI